MLNEKYNNHNSWKTALDQLPGLPGEEPYDMNAAWEKLSLRLDTKKGSRKAAWYWIAAAGVFTCILIVGITGINKKQSGSQPISANIKPAVKEPVQVFNRENMADISFKISLKKNKISAPGLHKISFVIERPVKKDICPAGKIRSEVKDPFEPGSIVSESVKSKPIVFSALTKKLPVVHINDLEKPVLPIEAVAGNNDRPSFSVRLFRKNISSEPSPVNNENGINIRIKLSPQN